MQQRYFDTKSFILNKLRSELPAHCYYHSYEHTVDMHESAERIAQFEGVSVVEMELVLVAALFHDAGFIIQAENHEAYSCEIARQVLPQFHYSDNEMKTICQLIMATKMPVTPKNKLEEIICDADLDYLGRDDFKSIGDLLYRELMESGAVQGLEQWNELQIRFLTNHQYYTSFSRANREEKKQENLKSLKNA